MPQLAALAAAAQGAGSGGAMRQLAWVCAAHAVAVPLWASAGVSQQALDALLDACPFLLLLRAALATAGQHPRLAFA